MYKIVIVEDNQDTADQLKTNVEAVFQKRGESCSVVHYGNPERFLSEYTNDTDIVFMDIDFAGVSEMNGMQTAHKLREKDEQVVLIFVTNLSQFAVNGYEVNALDFALKPVRQVDIERKLERALNRIRKDSERIAVTYDNRVTTLWVKDIFYVEISNHKLSFHTEQGVFYGSGTLQEMENTLGGKGFFKGNKWYIVNYRYIQRIEPDRILLYNGESLPLSRLRKQSIINEITRFIGKENVI